MTRLQRSFPSREKFVRTFVRRLSATGMEVELPEPSAPPPGGLVELDLRLEDGSPLVVGLGQVSPAGTTEGWQRIRFVELEDASRAEMAGLVALAEPPSGAPTKVDTRDPDETLESLVAGVFGGPERPPAPEDGILVPPEPEPTGEPPPAVERPAAPEPAEAPPKPPADTETPRRRQTLLQRLQVSPAVIVASIIAGATGAAANAWFEDLAAFFFELTAEEEDLAAPPEVDRLPMGIVPSQFTEAIEPSPADEPTALAAEAVPAAAEEAPVEAVTTPADRIRVITWDETAAGTAVTFWANGTFPAERVVRFRIPGTKPRELVKLRGIDVPFPQTVLELGSPEVERVRTGFHPQERVNELHMVLDLTGPDVVVDRVEHLPLSLRIHLRRGGAPPSDPPSATP